jgi:hypothetical protein
VLVAGSGALDAYSFLKSKFLHESRSPVLRVPGTKNWKDPSKPKLVEIDEATRWPEPSALDK